MLAASSLMAKASRNSVAAYASRKGMTGCVAPAAARAFSSAGGSPEEEMTKILQSQLKPEEVSVKDVSGGCGSAYNIDVTSSLFEGKNKVQQARMVYEMLGEHIKGMHSVKVTTKLPKK
mmetsp:Transcript_1076/g.2603  ORF Transcript_1076/g.2603 Transcript_1076/m.2603 type:complete len:119 (+) Transcript_1076:185-541(+)|eukprot:CAMPEP_0171493654 /NCGR_PEP_ID=MMETSP0958-20121227/5082_1 /TAXON_ID=87120 /ORGANISM="Aurantiochytrium limacinum, Strain ATCCMYA-1381" /LENGTH=118 /DNA_ID=CAMNT_0012027301 /DNA_START=87 /DNA_END=443 /DNA_ORIENTATION=-